jgi:hypothetical protein
VVPRESVADGPALSFVNVWSLVSTSTATRLRGRPERVFVSVDESTGKSTVSFHPADVGTPMQGDAAMKEARSIAEKFPGCTVHGPHFHTARPAGKPMRRRPGPGRPGRPPNADREGGSEPPETDD